MQNAKIILKLKRKMLYHVEIINSYVGHFGQNVTV